MAPIKLRNALEHTRNCYPYSRSSLPLSFCVIIAQLMLIVTWYRDACIISPSFFCIFKFVHTYKSELWWRSSENRAPVYFPSSEVHGLTEVCPSPNPVQPRSPGATTEISCRWCDADATYSALSPYHVTRL